MLIFFYETPRLWSKHEVEGSVYFYHRLENRSVWDQPIEWSWKLFDQMHQYENKKKIEMETTKEYNEEWKERNDHIAAFYQMLKDRQVKKGMEWTLGVVLIQEDIRFRNITKYVNCLLFLLNMGDSIISMPCTENVCISEQPEKEASSGSRAAVPGRGGYYRLMSVSRKSCMDV